jgi:hypothetical protein
MWAGQPWELIGRSWWVSCTWPGAGRGGTAVAVSAAVVDGRIETPAQTTNRRLAALLDRIAAGDPRALAEAAGSAEELERA